MTDSDHTDAWLVAAGRELDDLSSDASALAASITANLGRFRRPGRPLDTDDPGVQISDRVLKQIVAMRIRRALGRLVIFIDVGEDAGVIDSIGIGLVARYRDILPDDADRVRGIVTDVLTSLLGPDHAVTSGGINVRWQDLETHEWRS